MAPHSSTLAWKIPWREEPGRLQSMGSWRVGHDWATSLSLFTFLHWRRKWQPTPVFLPGESQGRVSLVGCRLWGCTELNMTETTWQQQHWWISGNLQQCALLFLWVFLVMWEGDKQVFKVNSKCVGRDIHAHLQIRSSLLPPVLRGELRTRLPPHLRIKTIIAPGRVPREIKIPQTSYNFEDNCVLIGALFHCHKSLIVF